MPTQHDLAEPALPRQQGGDGDTQPAAGKLLGSSAGPILGRFWAIVAGALWDRSVSS